MMRQVKAEILENKEIAGGFYRMGVESRYLAKAARPGQFVEVRCSDGVEPLLRRPLGIHRVSKTGIDLLYEVVGRGTEILARKKQGEFLDLIGPLGNGFSLPRATHGRQRLVILVAGGNGVAPLLFLAERLAAMKKEVSVLIGGCSKTHILCENDFKKLGAEVNVATEDGSRGRRGLVTYALNDLVALRDMQHSVIYACGPTGMLKAVAEIAKRSRIPCQVSLEEHMACGVGACLGCPVRVKRQAGGEYKMVCKDGPVFDAEEIAW